MSDPFSDSDLTVVAAQLVRLDAQATERRVLLERADIAMQATVEWLERTLEAIERASDETDSTLQTDNDALAESASTVHDELVRADAVVAELEDEVEKSFASMSSALSETHTTAETQRTKLDQLSHALADTLHGLAATGQGITASVDERKTHIASVTEAQLTSARAARAELTSLTRTYGEHSRRLATSAEEGGETFASQLDTIVTDVTEVVSSLEQAFEQLVSEVGQGFDQRFIDEGIPNIESALDGVIQALEKLDQDVGGKNDALHDTLGEVIGTMKQIASAIEPVKGLLSFVNQFV